MLKSGVIVDVANVEQARIAEDSGAVAVMALGRVPIDIWSQREASGISDVEMINQIISAVSVPVIARARCGQFVDAQILQSLGVDFIDESEVSSQQDSTVQIDKWSFTAPFICGASDLGEAMRRITEGAAMLRAGGDTSTGDVSNAMARVSAIQSDIAKLAALSNDQLLSAAEQLRAPFALVKEVAASGKLPVMLYASVGLANPSDIARVMQLGADGVFVGSAVFDFVNPGERTAALANAITFYDEPTVIAKIARELGSFLV